MLTSLWHHLSAHRKKQFLSLLVLMTVASLAEIISVGSVLPFLGILTAPEMVFEHPMMGPLIQLLEVKEAKQLMLPLTIIFIIATLLAGIIRLTLLYVMTRLSFATGADLSIKIYRNTLYQEYLKHAERNSSEVIAGIINKTNTVTGGVISPILILVSSFFLLLGIMSALFIINLKVALATFIGLGLLYWAVISLTRQQLKENSQTIADNTTIVVKSLQEGLGGIRDVLIDGSQQFYCKLYRKADLPLRRAQGNNVFIGGSPRYLMEALGMILIAALAYSLTKQDNGSTSTIAILGALALGAQRLLPVLQHAYSAYTSINASKSSFQDVLDLLNQPLPIHATQAKIKPITFKKYIELNNLSFSYTKNSKWELNDINLRIKKGTRIGFMGLTGSGKSTLIDLIMGLIPPVDGELCIDGQSITNENRKSWQAHIAHVPQNIYLSDSTLEENIAFGVPKDQINHQLVEKVVKQAQIADLIDQLEDGYQAFVGERGVRLSGGQRQRIGIARALYKEANVLVFDEATSSLDNETEQAVMDSIEALDQDLTILIIAHRLTTLKWCDTIIKLSQNNEIQVLNYKDL
jgi:ATP-binding cassette, subfamily B, bacterial PglK